MNANQLKEAITFAISAVRSRIGRISQQTAELVQRELDRVVTGTDPVWQAETYVELLRKYGAPDATARLRSSMAALTTLQGFAKQLESEPTGQLVYEFYVGAGYDYNGGGDLSEPINEHELTGPTGALLGLLQAMDVVVEWQPRTNRHRASFVVKAS